MGTAEADGRRLMGTAEADGRRLRFCRRARSNLVMVEKRRRIELPRWNQVVGRRRRRRRPLPVQAADDSACVSKALLWRRVLWWNPEIGNIRRRTKAELSTHATYSVAQK